MRARVRPRCAWAAGSPEMTRYHDEEWGVPVRDDRKLFELLILEGAQAGLSWSTILHKRPAYRRAFLGFDPARVARLAAADVRRLMRDAGIVRNRLKIEATIVNARALLEVQREYGGFGEWLWALIGGRPVTHGWRSRAEVPAETPAARALSRALRQRGFRFVGPTICYAFMQASGMVNDHTTTCFRWRQLRAPWPRRASSPPSRSRGLPDGADSPAVITRRRPASSPRRRPLGPARSPSRVVARAAGAPSRSAR